MMVTIRRLRDMIQIGNVGLNCLWMIGCRFLKRNRAFARRLFQLCDTAVSVATSLE
jgi:hypothetical protein